MTVIWRKVNKVMGWGGVDIIPLFWVLSEERHKPR